MEVDNDNYSCCNYTLFEIRLYLTKQLTKRSLTHNLVFFYRFILIYVFVLARICCIIKFSIIYLITLVSMKPNRYNMDTDHAHCIQSELSSCCTVYAALPFLQTVITWTHCAPISEFHMIIIITHWIILKARRL